MNVGAILVGIALLIGVGAFIARPLFERTGGRALPSRRNGDPASQLTARRDAIYALIRELDADYHTGKINSGDYEALRQRYVAEGVDVLRQLDALPSQDGRAALEREIEARVLALRQSGPALQPGFEHGEARFCTKCGGAVDPEDRFCARCGAALRRGDPE